MSSDWVTLTLSFIFLSNPRSRDVLHACMWFIERSEVYVRLKDAYLILIQKVMFSASPCLCEGSVLCRLDNWKKKSLMYLWPRTKHSFRNCLCRIGVSSSETLNICVCSRISRFENHMSQTKLYLYNTIYLNSHLEARSSSEVLTVKPANQISVFIQLLSFVCVDYASACL